MLRRFGGLFILAALGLCGAAVFAVAAGSSTQPANGLPSLPPPDFSAETALEVVRVIDGDTIVVKADGKDVTVRLIGIDTPETVHPFKPVQEYGKEASRFTANLLKGERVYLITDPQQAATDKYGRGLAYVYRVPDGLFVNAEILRQGYGHAYPNYPFRYLEQFRQLERFARESGKGLWSPTSTAEQGAKPAETQPAQQAPQPVTAAPDAVPPAVAKPQAQPSAAGEVTVYITKTGAKYHSSGCRYLAKSSIPISLKEAKARYSPCSVCNPPQ